jgi:hypothetical protein
MNHLHPALVAPLAAVALAVAAADHSGAADTAPRASTSSGFLTIAEARQATRREVFRIARRRGNRVEDFAIRWCRRRARQRVGCRYAYSYPFIDQYADCHGGARVVERAENRRATRAWRKCVVSSDG